MPGIYEFYNMLFASTSLTKHSTSQLVFLKDALYMTCYQLLAGHPTALLSSIPHAPHVAFLMSLKADESAKESRSWNR